MKKPTENVVKLLKKVHEVLSSNIFLTITCTHLRKSEYFFILSF